MNKATQIEYINDRWVINVKMEWTFKIPMDDLILHAKVSQYHEARIYGIC